MGNPTPPTDINWNLYPFGALGANGTRTVNSPAGNAIIRQGDGGLWDGTASAYVLVDQARTGYPNV